jgi:hypothetical protein
MPSGGQGKRRHRRKGKPEKRAETRVNMHNKKVE